MGKAYKFAEIYKIHCEHKITAEKLKLEKNILNKDNSKDMHNNTNNRKLKI